MLSGNNESSDEQEDGPRQVLAACEDNGRGRPSNNRGNPLRLKGRMRMYRSPRYEWAHPVSKMSAAAKRCIGSGRELWIGHSTR
jgi:hypothetical protein